MDRLWAPWRMTYIKEIDKCNDGCIFCTKPSQASDRENLLLYRGKTCYILMNLYPYNNGHLMVIPYRHTADLLDLDTECCQELLYCTGLAKKNLSTAFNPDAFNIGMNLGRVAGAGIDQHLHMHVVPRWTGDTNFMSTIGDTKVISQALHETYDILLPLFQSTGASSSAAQPSR